MWNTSRGRATKLLASITEQLSLPRATETPHPRLFALAADPYDTSARFDKRVRDLCGLFGHHVHVVASRSGGTEYACRNCGHPFLSAARERQISADAA
jgi:hypothetical protein